MSALVYARRSDNVAATVTPTLKTGTINANFPITRLIDRDPATAAKTTSTGDSRWLWSYAGAQRVDAVWLPMHNAPAGTVLRFEGHTSDSWGAPTVSATHTVQAYGGDLPRGVYIDVTAAANYSASGLQFWSLFVPNAGLVTALGEIFISSRKRTMRNLVRGVQRPRGRAVVMHDRADGGHFVYDRGVNAWAASGSVRANATIYADYLALFEDANGAVYPFPVVLDTHLAVPEGHLVRWVTPFLSANYSYQHENVSFTWQMVARGRAL